MIASWVHTFFLYCARCLKSKSICIVIIIKKMLYVYNACTSAILYFCNVWYIYRIYAQTRPQCTVHLNTQQLHRDKNIKSTPLTGKQVANMYGKWEPFSMICNVLIIGQETSFYFLPAYLCFAWYITTFFISVIVEDAFNVSKCEAVVC